MTVNESRRILSGEPRAMTPKEAFETIRKDWNSTTL